MKITGRIKDIKISSTKSSKRVTLDDGREFYAAINEIIAVGEFIEVELQSRGTGYNGKLIMFAKSIIKLFENP